jgi:hypothetical protein
MLQGVWGAHQLVAPLRHGKLDYANFMNDMHCRYYDFYKA